LQLNAGRWTVTRITARAARLLPASERLGAPRFEFEHEVRWTEAEFGRLRELEPFTRRGKLLLLLVAAVGAALLAPRWTAPVGFVLLLLAVFFWFTPRMGRSGVRTEFSEARYLRGPVTYGVGTDGIWVRGGPLSAQSGWAGLKVWDRRHGWLMLAASGMPPVYLPEDGLRAAGLYDTVLALARRHGTEFERPAQQRQSSEPSNEPLKPSSAEELPSG
jgi:hypothetical protein